MRMKNAGNFIVLYTKKYSAFITLLYKIEYNTIQIRM